MKKVAIVGIGITPFRARYLDKTYFELAYDATKLALEDANKNGAEITHDNLESTVYGIYNELFERQFMPDIFINSYIGMNNKPGTRIASGGATGGYTVRMAYAEVASGLSDLCLCLGVEKCNDCYDKQTGVTTPEVLNAIAYSADMTYEYPMGMMAASSYVSMVNAHYEEFGNPTEEQMAYVSVKNHGNALLNPKAQSPMKVSVEDVLNSRIICFPFKMLDCCLYSEASAALILANEDKVKELGVENPIWITGVAAANTDCFIGNREDMGRLYSNIYAAKSAYKMAGLDYNNIKSQIDLAELHDAFSGQEVISYEELGFVPFGEGGPWIKKTFEKPGEGPWLEGELPCCPSGGLIGCGHAVGATGIMSTGEAALQLREEAGRHQVPITKGRAISHSIGGPGAAYAAIIVMANEEGLKKTMNEKFQDHQIRDVIKINYKYTMGGQSKFFIELKNNKRLLGTKCTKCGKTWMPPRINCSDCYEPADWVELKQTGTIEVSTIVWYTTSAFIKAIPYGVGYIKLDGAETALLQGIFSENLVPSKLKKGKKVKAVFNKERVGKMTDFFFVPVDEYERWISKPEYEGGV